MLLVPHSGDGGPAPAPAFLAASTAADDSDRDSGAAWGFLHVDMPDHDDHPPRKDTHPDVVAAAGVAAPLPAVAVPARVWGGAAPEHALDTRTVLRC